MAKLSYFSRNMHARGRAQVFQRFPASYLRFRGLSLSYEEDLSLQVASSTNMYICEMADKIPLIVTRRSRATLVVISP